MADSPKQYLVIDDNGKGHLPVRDSPDGPLNHRLMGAAWAALHGGYRGNKYEGPGKEEALRKLKALYESEGMDLPTEQADRQMGRQASGKDGTTANLPNSPSAYFAFAAPLVSIDGTVRIPILVTGSWFKNGHEVTFTLDDLRTAVANFHKLANRDLNVDYDHASEDLQRAEGNPTPSAGRIVALDEPEQFRPSSFVTSPLSNGAGATPEADAKDNGQRSPFGSATRRGETKDSTRWILYGRYEPTQRARTLIQNREYRYTSAAFATHYRDRQTGEDQGLTLTSVALTNQPFLDELPEIWLSIKDVRGPWSAVRQTNDPSALGNEQRTIDNGQRTAFNNGQRTTDNGQISNRLSAEQGGRTMAKLRLSRAADGTHEVLDADGKQVGTIDHDHLCQYCRTNLADDLKLSMADERLVIETANRPANQNGGTIDNRQWVETFAKQVGAEGKTIEQIRGLVAVALDPPKPEVTLLCEAVGAEGKLDNSKLDALDDSGQISRSAWRRAKEAEQRVQNAFSRGQITPAMLATGAPLRLALSDGAAFQALVEDRPAIVKPNSVIGIGGTGSETGESPRQLFSRLVEEKKQQLLQANTKLSELEAHRQASGLVAKENPELLKNYRADARTA